MAEKFNIRPVYVDFLNTLDEKLSSSDVWSEIHVSRKESCDGPIRHLATRVKEHATSSSAIKEHLSSCTACKDNYSCNSFKVIDSANSDFEVSIKEALHIKHRNPNLNKQLSTQGMSFMLKIFT